MARGKVPKPAYMEHYQARINAVAGQNCTEMARDLKGSAWHTEVGGFIGTMRWFDDPANGALTDFQIGGPWDGQYDGVIMRFIEEDQGVVPWANGVMGKVRPPFDEAAIFIARWVTPTGNAENLNARARSIELSDGGHPDVDRVLTGRQIESLAFNTAYIHSEEVGQSWDAFTDNFLHYQTGTDHVGCPGQWLKANKAAVRARTVAIMKAYQTNTKLDHPLLITYPPGWTGGEIPQPGAAMPAETFPKPYAFPKYDGHDHDDFKALKRVVIVKRGGGAERYTRASRNMPKTGPNFSKGTTVPVIYAVKADDGTRWYVHEQGDRMPMTHFEETFSTNLWRS